MREVPESRMSDQRACHQCFGSIFKPSNLPHLRRIVGSSFNLQPRAQTTQFARCPEFACSSRYEF
jgi:hypothetical protein